MYLLIRFISLLPLGFCLTLSASNNYFSVQTSYNANRFGDFSIELIKQADAHFDQEEYEEALELYSKAFPITDAIQEPDQKAKLLLQIGKCHQRLNAYAEAQDHFAKFLHLARQTDLAHEEGRVLGYLASIYNEIGDFEKSHNYQLKALAFSERNRDSLGIARSLYDLGTLFFFQKDFPSSLRYYQESMDICSALENKSSIFSCIAAMGSTYLEMDSLQKALDYNLRSLEFAREVPLRSGEGYAMNNIGANYLRLGEFDLAESYLLESVKIGEELKHKRGQVSAYINLGDLAQQRNNWPMAIHYWESGLVISKEILAKAWQADLSGLLAEAYYQVGNYRASRAASKKHAELKDELVNEETLKTMAHQQAKYEIQKREQEIKLLKKENEIKILHLNFFKIMIALTLLLGSLGFLSYRMMIQKRMNRQLGEKNEQIWKQNKRLEFTNGELKKFAYIASHDLKAPLRSIGSFTGLLRRRYGNQFDETAEEYMRFIIEGAKRMDQLLNDLLAYSNIEKLAYGQDKGITRLEDWLDTRSSVREALANLSYSINEHQADIQVNEIAMPKLRANPTHMTQLFQNIIANGIKFKRDASPAISIDCKTDEKNYTFSIQDNGIGIEEEFKDKIFEMFSRLNNVELYEGTGIGLATCKKIVEHHGGEIWVESELGKGSTFFFTIPKEI